jgi:hypothetical protein
MCDIATLGRITAGQQALEPDDFRLRHIRH